MHAFANFLNLVISFGYSRAALDAEDAGLRGESERLAERACEYKFAYVANDPYT